MPWRYDSNGEVLVYSPAKETRLLDALGAEREYVLEKAIVADYALVRAAKGDRHGNLVFEKATRAFNPVIAMSGRITIAEVIELVEPGEIDPDSVHLPGIYVHRVVQATPEAATDLPIEKRTTRQKPASEDLD